MPKLIFNDPETDHEVTLTLGDSQPEVTVGRNPGNTLRVNNPSISRRHAKIVWENGEVTLYDLDSSNGCYVNGNRVRSQVLADGDRLRIGEFPVVFVDETDSATSEVSPHMIESVLQNHKQTHLGGFGPPEPPAFEPPAFEPPAFEPPAFESGAEQHFGQPAGYGPESYGFSNQGADFNAPAFQEEPGFAMGGGSGLAFGGPPQPAFSGAPVPPQFPAAQNWDVEDEEPIELEPDLTDESEPDEAIEFADDLAFEHEPSGVEELGSAVSAAEEDLNTRNAAPGEIAGKLGAFMRGDDAPDPNYDSTVEQSVDSFMALRAAAQAGLETAELQKRLDAVTKERDELADVLNNRVGDGNAANQLQIDRLRKERDRLTEERRNLMRQLADTKKSLEDAPTADQVSSLEHRVAELEGHLAQANQDVRDFQRDVESRDAKVDELRAQLEQLRAVASDKDSAQRYSAELAEQLGQANDALQASQRQNEQLVEELNETKGSLERAFGEVESLDAELAERDQKLESLTDLVASLRADMASREAQLEDLRMALEESLSEGVQLRGTVERLEGELQLRPVAEEVVDLRARLHDAETQRNQLRSERDELVTLRVSLEAQVAQANQTVESTNARFSKIGGEFDALRKERDELKEERVAFARETDYLQVERRKLTDEVEDLRKKVKAADKEAKRKKQIFEELSGDLRKLVQENNGLQDKVKSLEERLKVAPTPERVVELESALKRATEQVNDLEQDNADLTRDLGKFSEEKSALQERVETLESDLSVARAGAESGEEAVRTLSELSAERDGLRERLAELEPQLEALETAAMERDELQQTLEAKSAEIQDLQAKLEEAMASAADAARAGELRKKLDEAEMTLANIILERDQLEDELKKLKK